MEECVSGAESKCRKRIRRGVKRERARRRRKCRPAAGAGAGREGGTTRCGNTTALKRATAVIARPWTETAIPVPSPMQPRKPPRPPRRTPHHRAPTRAARSAPTTWTPNPTTRVSCTVVVISETYGIIFQPLWIVIGTWRALWRSAKSSKYALLSLRLRLAIIKIRTGLLIWLGCFFIIIKGGFYFTVGKLPPSVDNFYVFQGTRTCNQTSAFEQYRVPAAWGWSKAHDWCNFGARREGQSSGAGSLWTRWTRVQWWVVFLCIFEQQLLRFDDKIWPGEVWMVASRPIRGIRRGRQVPLPMLALIRSSDEDDEVWKHG